MGDEERGKRLVAVFLLGLGLLNFPLLAVIDASRNLLGLPPLIFYLFGAWGALILLLVLIVERRRPRRGQGS
jgi:hypothetical protein